MYSEGWAFLLLIGGVLTRSFPEWFGEKLVEFAVGLRVPPITIEEITFAKPLEELWQEPQQFDMRVSY